MQVHIPISVYNQSEIGLQPAHLDGLKLSADVAR
jgi:hypothetical protein